MDVEHQRHIVNNANLPPYKAFSQIDISRISLAQLLQHDDRKFWSRATLSTLGLLGILFGIFLIFAELQMGEAFCSINQATCPQGSQCECTPMSYIPVGLSGVFPMAGFFAILASTYRTKLLAVVCAVFCVLGYVMGALCVVAAAVDMQNVAFSERFKDTSMVQFYGVLLALAALNFLITVLTSTFLFRACCYCRIRSLHQ